MRYARLVGRTVGRCEGCGQRLEASASSQPWSDWAFGCTRVCTLRAVRRRRAAWMRVKNRQALPAPWRDYLESVAEDTAWVREQLTAAFEEEIVRLSRADATRRRP